jgi:hypothetical protein
MRLFWATLGLWETCSDEDEVVGFDDRREVRVTPDILLGTVAFSVSVDLKLHSTWFAWDQKRVLLVLRRITRHDGHRST